MVKFTKLISTSIDGTARRILKVLRLGKSDVQTSFECAPYGIDSNPIKDMIAIHAPSSEAGKTVVIGYINKNQMADVGEIRIFATNAQGAEQSYMWAKNNGDVELNGSANSAVRYAQLNSALQQQVTLINAELVKIQTGLAGVAGVYVPVPIQLDISGAEVSTVKVP